MTNYEGQYFIFDFCAKYTKRQNGQALAVFKVEEGRLEQLFHPCDDGEEGELGSIGEKQDDKAVEILKEREVRVVYTLQGMPYPSELFGFKLCDGDPNKDEDWFIYWGIFDGKKAWLLNKEGIKVELYK